MTRPRSAVAIAIVCAFVVVLSPAATADVNDGSPFGYVDRVDLAVGGRAVVVQGWTIDPQTADPIAIHVYRNGQLVLGDVANQSRVDVGAAFAGYGDRHGYAVTVPVEAGSNVICVYGINVGPGTNAALACREVNVNDSPFGALDRVDQQAGTQTIAVQGWVIDPQSTEPIGVHVYVNGRLVAGDVANQSRVDVGAAFPGFGDRHGYALDIAMPAGISAVCVYGLNVAEGSNSLIACHEVGVAGSNGSEGVMASGALMVAHYGSAADARLGVLGSRPPTAAAAAVRERAAQWLGFGRPVVPAFDYIASVATASPGPDGDYSTPSDPESLRPWLDAIRSVGGVLLLDIQPGRTDFLTEVRRYEALLLEPDVGLALDPEWRMDANQVPGQVIGSVSADEINAVTRYVAELVRANHLPRKLIMVHQFTPFMVRDRDRLEKPAELTIAIQLDGFGSPEAKVAKYRDLHASDPFLSGFKLFLTQDTRLMAPAEVMTFVPPPSYISYQ